MNRLDEDIRAEIMAELRWDPLLNAEHVVVWLMDGAVGLTGFVVGRDDVWRASLIAARVSGVRSVTNHLEVKQRPDGRATTADVSDPRRVVLLPLPRPPRWEIEDWLEDVTPRSNELDAASILPPPV